MPAAARLTEIVDALEMQNEASLSFLDRETGDVETVSKDLLSEAEESDEMSDIPAWQEPEWELAKRIAASVRFVRLPREYDIHEWEIMREFSNAIERKEIRAELLDAIHGAGAFRSFKAALRRRGIESDWFAFRAAALRQIAMDWCSENGIAWK